MKNDIKSAIQSNSKYVIASLQQIKAQKLPIIVLVEGWSAAGKGRLINDLIADIDPRFFNVFCRDTIQNRSRYPFLYPYFNAIPENGKFLFMDSGWMEDCVADRCSNAIDEQTYNARLSDILCFERQLRDNGYIVIKLFMSIPKNVQGERIKKLKGSKNTAWRVTETDLWQHRHYEEFALGYSDFMAATGSIFPWHTLDGTDRSKSLCEAFNIIADAVKAGLETGKYCGEAFDASFTMSDPLPKLEDADLSASISEEDYKAALKSLQKRIKKLHNIIYRKRIPVVICYEGWDAAGKGGNIRRLAKPLDPRGFDVQPIASPEPHELARHYLWRFWKRLPKSGHVAIFDRTWYGRVMVERIEGYCSEKDWQRAYNEINEFEQQLHNWGAVIIKFWLQIDPNTQLERFQLRQSTPEKQWKITEEDWRNREKWPQYQAAVSEMLEKTSTAIAPWHIIQSVDKRYARIKALTIVAEAMEAAIAEK